MMDKKWEYDTPAIFWTKKSNKSLILRFWQYGVGAKNGRELSEGLSLNFNPIFQVNFDDPEIRHKRLTPTPETHLVFLSTNTIAGLNMVPCHLWTFGISL